MGDLAVGARAVGVGAFEAKNKFGQLLDWVEAGEAVAITRRGKVVAHLAPSGGALNLEAASAAAARIRARRRGVTLGSAKIADLIAEGRPEPGSRRLVDACLVFRGRSERGCRFAARRCHTPWRCRPTAVAARSRERIPIRNSPQADRPSPPRQVSSRSSMLPIEIDGECDARVWPSALPLADQFGLSVYDACYLELAQRRDLTLATLDARLRSSGAAVGLRTTSG